jgi:hypothetical protein
MDHERRERSRRFFLGAGTLQPTVTKALKAERIGAL